MVLHADRPVPVVVYRITGRQGFIDIPHRFCEECDLTVRVVGDVVDEFDGADVTMVVRPWMLWFWKPLPRGGWHAPIVTVNGRVVSQGVVPTAEAIRQAVRAARGRQPERRDGGGQAATP